MRMTPIHRLKHTLRALGVGDCFGQRFFFMDQARLLAAINSHELPDGPWAYTDDSEMADVLAAHLLEHGRVDQDGLAADFARGMDPERGYGAGAAQVLQRIARGDDWRRCARALFGGVGSFGNGAAMRVAPLGAFFADQALEEVAAQARASAEVTHSHPEGVAGAVAVAVGTAALYQKLPLFDSVLPHVSPGYLREGLEEARALGAGVRVLDAAVALGNGSGVSAPDTVPFCFWVVALGLPFEASLWQTIAALGDRDTTCAIVAGMLSGSVDDLPESWVERAEATPVLRR